MSSASTFISSLLYLILLLPATLMLLSFIRALIKVIRKHKRVKRGIKKRVVTRFMQLNQAQQLVRSIFLRAIISRFKDCDRRDTHAQQY